LGREVRDAFALRGPDGELDPIELALEWGVRRLGERLTLRTRAGIEKPVVADVFPALDEDGGLLVALAAA
ncbi:MAG TPA: hypothetical protein VFB26_08535, partial [Gaiellaceae bacterium]|nr:hypothetical protein [Gaiellaceae bacterium]